MGGGRCFPLAAAEARSLAAGRGAGAAGRPVDWLCPEVRLWGDAGRAAAAAAARRPCAALAHTQRAAWEGTRPLPLLPPAPSGWHGQAMRGEGGQRGPQLPRGQLGGGHASLARRPRRRPALTAAGARGAAGGGAAVTLAARPAANGRPGRTRTARGARVSLPPALSIKLPRPAQRSRASRSPRPAGIGRHRQPRGPCPGTVSGVGGGVAARLGRGAVPPGCRLSPRAAARTLTALGRAGWLCSRRSLLSGERAGGSAASPGTQPCHFHPERQLRAAGSHAGNRMPARRFRPPARPVPAPSAPRCPPPVRGERRSRRGRRLYLACRRGGWHWETPCFKIRAINTAPGMGAQPRAAAG